MTSQAVEPQRHRDSSLVGGRPLDLDGRRFYQISAYDQIPPFFMTIVGASDLWLFISSTGGVTAGRAEAERALFPYYTEDKVTESAGRTGGLSILRVTLPDRGAVSWQPFAETRAGDAPVERNLYKDYLGTTLVFEESRADLGLRLRVTWQTSARYGVVREVEVTSTTDRPARAEVLDGFVDLLPAGVTVQTQGELSRLLDAYKRAEVDPGSTVVLAGMANYSWRDLPKLLDADRGLPFDAAAVHPFTGRPSNVLKIIKLNRKVLAARGRRATPLWLTEMTWSSAVGKKTPLLKGWETTERGQATRLETVFALMTRERRRLGIGRVFWYTWATRDDGSPNSFEYSGLRTTDGRPGPLRDKPALAAFKRATP